MAKELDDLGTLDPAGLPLAVEPVLGQASARGKTLPAEGFVDQRRLTAGSPCRCAQPPIALPDASRIESLETHERHPPKPTRNQEKSRPG